MRSFLLFLLICSTGYAASPDSFARAYLFMSEHYSITLSKSQCQLTDQVSNLSENEW
ncbi:hypothetical protein [Legionella sp.]|uniref:hypothetical protein n=1 Tax=Legionella sp. TaxID=459 RepID=UPI003CB9CE0F